MYSGHIAKVGWAHSCNTKGGGGYDLEVHNNNKDKLILVGGVRIELPRVQVHRCTYIV